MKLLSALVASLFVLFSVPALAEDAPAAPADSGAAAAPADNGAKPGKPTKKPGKKPRHHKHTPKTTTPKDAPAK